MTHFFKQASCRHRRLTGALATLLLAGCTLLTSGEDPDAEANTLAARAALLEQKAAACEAGSSGEVREELLDQRRIWELVERAGFYPVRQKLTQGVLEVSFEERVILREKQFDRYQRVRHTLSAQIQPGDDAIENPMPSILCVENWVPVEIIRRNERYSDRSREQWRPLPAETLLLEVRGLDYQQRQYASYSQSVALAPANSDGYQLRLSLAELAGKLPERPTEMQLIFHQEHEQHTATINLSRGVINSLRFESNLWKAPTPLQEARRL